MTNQPDIAAFLLAQIAADEQVAREAHYEGQRWLSEEEDVHRWPDDELVHFADRKRDAAHIARWDPSRVLAECAARRAIVQHLHHELSVGIRNIPAPEDYASCVCGWDETLVHGLDYDEAYERHLFVLGVNDKIAEAVLRLLAQPYADVDGFDPAWRLGNA